MPVFIGADLGDQGYAVIKLSKTATRPVPNEAGLKQDRAQYGQWWTGAESLAYYGVLKDRIKVDIRAPKPSVNGAEPAGSATK